MHTQVGCVLSTNNPLTLDHLILFFLYSFFRNFFPNSILVLLHLFQATHSDTHVDTHGDNGSLEEE